MLSKLFQAAKDLGGFSVMFFIIYFAFVQLGYLLFGVQVTFLIPKAQISKIKISKYNLNGKLQCWLVPVLTKWAIFLILTSAMISGLSRRRSWPSSGWSWATSTSRPSSRQTLSSAQSTFSPTSSSSSSFCW